MKQRLKGLTKEHSLVDDGIKTRLGLHRWWYQLITEASACFLIFHPVCFRLHQQISVQIAVFVPQ